MVKLTLSIDGDLLNAALFARSKVAIELQPAVGMPVPLKAAELEYPPQLTLGKRHDYSIQLSKDLLTNQLSRGRYDLEVRAGDYANKSKVPLSVNYYLVTVPLSSGLPKPAVAIGYASSGKHLFALQRDPGNSLSVYSIVADKTSMNLTLIAERVLDEVRTNQCAAAPGKHALFLHCGPLSVPDKGFFLRYNILQAGMTMTVTQPATPSFVQVGFPTLVVEDSEDPEDSAKSFLLASSLNWSVLRLGPERYMAVPDLPPEKPNAGMSGDLNGDGKSEYVLWTSGTFTILSPNGGEGWALDRDQSAVLNAAWASQGISVGVLAMGDLLGVKYPQLVAMDRTAARLLILSPPRGGEAWDVVKGVLPKIDLGGDEVISLQVADIDGDGVNDLLMGTGRNTSPRPSITRLWLLRAGKVGTE
ncbi:MAG TPA: hypothetical protein PKI03_11240 [Pseudomonadota bacterium]|nr:hypothetical protein [Pseudomonadota bacterium]